MSAEPGRGTGRWVAAYARVVVRLRWLVVAVWLSISVGCVMFAPSLDAGSGGVEGFVSADSAAIQTEIRSVRQFGFPLLSRVAVVQRDPDGLSALTQAEAVVRAAAVTQGQYDDVGPIVGAIPVPNTFGAFPGSQERGTTVITLLFIPPNVGFAEQTATARAFAANHFGPGDSVVGVTGSIPARVEQGRVLDQWLVTVETATLAAVVLIVAVAFRSVLAPLFALVTAGIAIVVTLNVAGLLGSLLGVQVPGELEPLLVALLLGVVTDYVIFYLFGLRQQLSAGEPQRVAVPRATAQFTPTVAVAGITVACGTGALLVAESPLFRAFGPGMAFAVLVGLAVAVTFVPAMLAILGGAVFWPSRPTGSDPVRTRRAGRMLAARSRRMERLVRRRTAGLVLLGGVVALVFAALPVRHLDLGLSFVPSLPADNSVRHAAAEAKRGFSEGIVSPTVLLVEGPDITARRAALERLGELLTQRSGVAGVFGPGDQIVPIELGLVLSRDGDAARYLIVLDDQPLGASAIDTVSSLRADLPALLATAGLSGVAAGVAGDTAIAENVVAGTEDDLRRITVATLVVNMLLVVLFLRALVAPLYLLATNVLALAATLGLTTWVFQVGFGHDGLTFYVPFAAAVLLVAFGSDYNIFSVGHVWQQARDMPLRDALVTAMPHFTPAVTAAGVTLAASFGLLALVPLRPFREVAFVMAVGILIDALVVRSLLVPALLTLVGPVSAWPSRHLRARLARTAAVAPAPDPRPGGPPAARRPDRYRRRLVIMVVVAATVLGWIWLRVVSARRRPLSRDSAGRPAQSELDEAEMRRHPGHGARRRFGPVWRR